MTTESNVPAGVTEDKKGWESAIEYVSRDSGEIIRRDLDQIVDIEQIVPTGTWDVPQKDTEDCIGETIIICDVMDMAKGKYGNQWFLALCADPDADLQNDEGAYFTLPFGGYVSGQKIAKIGGYDLEIKDNKIVGITRNSAKPNRFPIKAKVVQIENSDPGKNPYIDLVSPNSK